MKAGRTPGFFEPAALRRCFAMFSGGLVMLLPTDGDWVLVVGTFMMSTAQPSSI